MYFLKSKKGASTEMSLAHILDLGLVVVAILMLVSFVYKASNGEFIEEKKVAINNGLLIDALLSSNGDISISKEIGNNTVSIMANEVGVGESPWSQKFQLLEDTNTNMFSNFLFKEVTHINLFKTGNNLFIKKEEPSFSSLYCSPSFFEKPKEIILLPKTRESIEDDFIFHLGNALRDQDIEVERRDFFNEIVPFAIKINFTDSKLIEAQIPPDSDKSRKLACEIINKLQMNYLDNKVKIRVSEDPLFQNADNSIIFSINKELRGSDTILLFSEVFE